MSFNLLDYSKGGGCGCKIEPQKLHEVLSKLDIQQTSNVVVGFSENEDASVIDFGAHHYLIHTTDFFLPVVNDPYDFGRIAAANAISDVYAMGAKPISALSILGWPVEKIPLEYASEVIKGASEVCKLAGISISGGHSIESSDPIFGLCVSGLVEKQNLKRNNTCHVGDSIYITKPLGLGLLANAVKLKAISEQGYSELIKYSTQLNSIGPELAESAEISAMTDVTGFGLLGHLTEMLGKDKGANIVLEQVPVIEEAKELASKMMYPNITTSNFNFVNERCVGLNGLEFLWLCDPQTSGGLLIAGKLPDGLPNIFKIGEVTDTGKIHIL